MKYYKFFGDNTFIFSIKLDILTFLVTSELNMAAI